MQYGRTPEGLCINGLRMESSTSKIFVEHALHVARSLEPRPNSRGLGTAGSVMTFSSSINECSHSKNQIMSLVVACLRPQ